MAWGLRVQLYYPPERRSIDDALALDISELVPSSAPISVECHDPSPRRWAAAAGLLQRTIPDARLVAHLAWPLDGRVPDGALASWLDAVRRAGVEVHAIIAGNEPNAPGTWVDPARAGQTCTRWWFEEANVDWMTAPALSFVGQGQAGDWQNPLRYAEALVERFGTPWNGWAINAYGDLTHLPVLIARLRQHDDSPVWITECGLTNDATRADYDRLGDEIDASGADHAIWYSYHAHPSEQGMWGVRPYAPSGRWQYTTDGEPLPSWTEVERLLRRPWPSR